MKKILITGASGFVGSFLVEEALKRGLKVHAGIRKTSSKKYLQDSRINFFELDFNDLVDLKRKLQQTNFDYVIHNAGVVKANKKEDFFKYNTNITLNFAQLLQEVYPNFAKFVYISSAAAYGPADNLAKGFVQESDTPQPIDTYGESKLAAEKWLQNQPNFPYLIFRPTGVYGPRETEIFTFFKAFNQGLEGHIGRTPQKMAFIYVKDLAKVVLDGTLSNQQQKAYFVSDGNAYPTQELGRIAAKFLNKKPLLKINIPIGVVQLVATIGEGFGKLSGKMPVLNLEKVKILKSKNWQVDIAPLQNDLNFAPAYNLESGLLETIKWYKVNKWL
ncbi:MAG: NAD(P)-dependent oxidoreductase [Bacteroidota bacterium]